MLGLKAMSRPPRTYTGLIIKALSAIRVFTHGHVTKPETKPVINESVFSSTNIEKLPCSANGFNSQEDR